ESFTITGLVEVTVVDNKTLKSTLATLIPRASIPCVIVDSILKGAWIMRSPGQTPGQLTSAWKGIEICKGVSIPKFVTLTCIYPVMTIIFFNTVVCDTMLLISGISVIGGSMPPPGPIAIISPSVVIGIESSATTLTCCEQ